MLLPDFLAEQEPDAVIGTIVHVGAHRGEGLRRYASLSPGTLVWVEADPDTFAELEERMAKLGPEVCPDTRILCVNALVAGVDGRSETFREFSNDGASSSMFAATEVLTRRWPDVNATGRTLQMTTRRLDGLLEDVGVAPEQVNALVLDVQGAEAECMRGAARTMGACRFLETEVSLEPIYEGGAHFPEVEELACAAGLTRRTDVPWHGDVVYVRSASDGGELPADPVAWFRKTSYIQHNQRRLEHLTSLGLELGGRRVLELGAGVGDHTHFYLDRGCQVTCVESRPENLATLRRHLADDLEYRLGIDFDMALRDLDRDRVDDLGRYDVVHCYGLLYHLADPFAFLERIAACVAGLLLLETAVSYSPRDPVGNVPENPAIPTQAMGTVGSRPDRTAVFGHLERRFEHVYMPWTQPWHEQFPVDWTLEKSPGPLTRAVFVASRDPLDHVSTLTPSVPDRQVRPTSRYPSGPTA